MGKINKEQLHVGRTLIRGLIVMLKWRHHVASQRIQNFLEVFFMFFQYKMRYLVVSKKKNPLFVWGWDRKIYPSRSLFVTTRQASWCQSLILGRIFLSQPHTHDRFLYNFEGRIVNIFLYIGYNSCLGCSKEPAHGDGSFEYPQHMFLLRSKKINF